jgi:hypothetical protein
MIGFVLLLQSLMRRAMFLFQLTVESAVFPPRHRILMRGLVLCLKLIVGVLMLCIKILMRPFVPAFIPVVSEYDR